MEWNDGEVALRCSAVTARRRTDEQTVAEARTFEIWKATADRLCREKHGLSLEDLPDVAYYDWWESGMAPREAVRMAVTEAME